MAHLGYKDTQVLKVRLEKGVKKAIRALRDLEEVEEIEEEWAPLVFRAPTAIQVIMAHRALEDILA